MFSFYMVSDNCDMVHLLVSTIFKIQYLQKVEMIE